jgi:hypothetical protein
MSNLDQVKSFARDYINGQQTAERRRIIAAAYYQLTGERVRRTCGTCYIEAIFTILKKMELKPCKYRLKKGALLQAFGNSDKICTNENLTNELAEWHLRNTRGAASLFAILPADAPVYGEEVKAIAEPAKEPESKPVVKAPAKRKNKR